MGCVVDMFELCSLKQYMTCVRQFQDRNDSCVDCVCSPTCEVVDYDPMFSISQLSDIEVDPDTEEQFRRAVETNSRVDTTILSNLLTSFVQLLSVERSLSDVISVNIVDSRTSVTGQILDSITTIVQVTQNCMSAALQKAHDFDVVESMVSFQTWLQNQASLTTALPLIAVDRVSIYYTLETEISWLTGLIERSNNGTLTTTQLAVEFATHRPILVSAVGNVSDLVLNGVDEELNGLANNYKQKITDTLIALMDQLQTVWKSCEKKVGETGLCTAVNKFARELFIWRKPIPTFRPTTDLDYTVGTDNVTSVWPTSVSIITYQRRMSQTNIRHNVDEFFAQLWPRLVDVQKDISRLVDSAQNLVGVKITGTLSSVSSQWTTGTEFVSKNYVKINVFYRDLKTSTQAQQTTYGLVQLFSEMGGNLGLLIGGGALTVFELADVVLYNLYLKARRRTNNKQPQSSTLTETSA